MFDFDNPFYRPLWLRLVLCAFCLGWGIFELVSGSPGWAVLFLAMGAYLVWRLFVTFNPRDDE